MEGQTGLGALLDREGVRYVRRAPLDPDNLRLACSLSQLAYWLHPMKHTPGVRKYRSVEEAWQARKESAEPAPPTE